MPPAPPRFSTTICWPSCSPRRTARMRVIVSGRPPAAYGTIIFTGWRGKSCASLLPGKAMTRKAKSKNARIVRPVYCARMSRLRLTLACWDYDRTQALADGRVRAQGIDLNYLSQPVEETFFRMMKFREFDASEMSLSSYVASLGMKTPPFIAIPAFPSRFFRHSCIFVSAKGGIRKPADLKGKRVGVPEYQMTAPVWIRGILSDDYGVKVAQMRHFSGGQEEPGRTDKLSIDLPRNIRLEGIAKGKTLSRMLADGELDAFFTARAPSTFDGRRVKRLFPDFVKAEKDYFRRTKIFPIMHTVVVRREVYEKNPWVAQSLYKAFAKAKAVAAEMYNQTA